MFSEQKTLCLQALVNCIIPADDFPNGWDAGVGDYLMRQFEGDLQDKVEVYKRGLKSLNIEAQAVYEQDFVWLSSDEQNDLLTTIEKGKVQTHWKVDPVDFLQMICEHCAEGYYSNPENGGNHDHVSWRMIGFEVRDDRL